MSESEDGLEKSEQATPKRLADAKDEGNVARSREFNTMAVVTVSALFCVFMGESTLLEFTAIFKKYFIFHIAPGSSESVAEVFLSAIKDIVFLMIPFLSVAFMSAFLGFAVGGLSFSAKSFTPKFSKINPVSGVKRIFSLNSFAEIVKSVLKFLFIAVVAYVLYLNISDELFSIGSGSEKAGILSGIRLVLFSLLVLCIPLVVVSLIDVPYQLWQHARKLKMTRQEVKDELKQTDGNPEMKGRVRAVQREIAQRRMMEEVPTANVVIVNPTHYAVALKYDEDASSAPKLVAKGNDLIALKIREIAEHHGVPVFSAPPLARAIYATTELNKEIPSTLYLAVAKVLAYVFQVKIIKRYGGEMPDKPEDLPVPDQYL